VPFSAPEAGGDGAGGDPGAPCSGDGCGDGIFCAGHGQLPENAQTATVSGVRIYMPTKEGMLPERILASAAMTTSTNFVNLVRQSVPTADANASADSTATPSKDGRRITPQRWNAPRLLFGGGFSSDAQTPNWIYLTAAGTAANAISTNVVGRFAFNVYETSGLLDANIAGYPGSLSDDQLATIKPTPAGADLSQIPGVSNADTFVSWRNTASESTATTYVAGVKKAARSGFLKKITGDNRLTSRQDLIKLAKLPELPEDDSLGITPDALPHLTTFSRALNAPSWQPRFDAGGS